MKAILPEIQRLPGHETSHPEIKDPNVIQLADNRFMLYTSIGNTANEKWLNGRFQGNSLKGPFQELPPVELYNICGSEMCAPAVTFDKKNHSYTMLLQTTCFQPGGIIASLNSDDGLNFYADKDPAMTVDRINKQVPWQVNSIYDPGTSRFQENGQTMECMVFSGYRAGHRVGCGDLYMSMRESGKSHRWGEPSLLVNQDDLAFHNKPGSDHFEWGLEGGKIDKLDEGLFLLTSVYFKDKPGREHDGTRQGIFLASSTALDKPFTPFALIEPAHGYNEIGHPDTYIEKDKVVLVPQTRKQWGHSWGLAYTEISKREICQVIDQAKSDQRPVTLQLAL